MRIDEVVSAPARLRFRRLVRMPPMTFRCVNSMAPACRDDYNIKSKSRHLWVSLNARF